MLRIIGGQFKNRILKTPRGNRTRPTSGIVRKAVFDICRDLIENARILDLFAGSGAMGLEALSRGACFATFIENDRYALLCLKENVGLLQVEKSVKILSLDAIKSLKLLSKSDEQFHLIYADPPYSLNAKCILEFLDQHPLLSKAGLLFIEEGYPAKLHEEKCILRQHQFVETRKFGRTLLHLFRRSINL